MRIDISAETDRILNEELTNGHFHSVDEVIRAAIRALRASRRPKSLVEFFRKSPLVGLELRFERDNDIGRNVAP